MALRLASPKYRAVICPNNFFMSLLFNGSYFIFSTLQISGFSMRREKDFSYFAVGISLSYKRGMILGKGGGTHAAQHLNGTQPCCQPAAAPHNQRLSAAEASLCRVIFRRFRFISFLCKRSILQADSQGTIARIGTQRSGQRRKYH